MKPEPIELEDQLKVITGGNLFEVCEKYSIDTTNGGLSLRPLLTVSRLQLIQYLQSHERVALEYFNNRRKQIIFHDGMKLWEKSGIYYSAWMDKGKETEITEYETLIEVVVESMMVDWGLY